MGPVFQKLEPLMNVLSEGEGLMRQLTLADHMIRAIDTQLRGESLLRASCEFPGSSTLQDPPDSPSNHPGTAIPEPTYTRHERRRVAGLMRVNHAGEVAAQALYEGHALLAQTKVQRQRMKQAATEERHHLHWCRQRLHELDASPSVLDPAWYLGGFAFGAFTAALGERWSLGVVAETERQVVRHLDDHLRRLPKNDARTRAILRQMVLDEARHGHEAVMAGGQDLPWLAQTIMHFSAKVMTHSAYWF